MLGKDMGVKFGQPSRVTTREERCFDIVVLVTSINFIIDV
jgi:hypothetical protein